MSSDEDPKTVETANLNLMKVAILQAEKNNVSTRNMNNAEMVEFIKKTIISYADKSY